MGKCLIWQDEYYLLSRLFNNPEPFQDFNDNFKEWTLNLSFKGSISVIKVNFGFKGSQFPDKILSCNEAVSFRVNLFKQFIQLSMATGYLIVKVVPQLWDFDLLMTLTDKFKEQVWIVALTMQQIMLELVDDLLSLAKFVKKVNVLFLLSLVHF